MVCDIFTWFENIVHVNICLCLPFEGMPRFASQPAPATVRQGDSQVMACEVNSDLVLFTRWEKDRQPLELNSRLVQLPSAALVISNATESDSGLYRCLVENVGSSKSSEEAQLQILSGIPYVESTSSRLPSIDVGAVLRWQIWSKSQYKLLFWLHISIATTSWSLSLIY